MMRSPMARPMQVCKPDGKPEHPAVFGEKLSSPVLVDLAARCMVEATGFEPATYGSQTHDKSRKFRTSLCGHPDAPAPCAPTDVGWNLGVGSWDGNVG